MIKLSKNAGPIIEPMSLIVNVLFSSNLGSSPFKHKMNLLMYSSFYSVSAIAATLSGTSP